MLQHTDCGITRPPVDPAKLAHYFQMQEAELRTKAITDSRAAVAVDVTTLQAIPALPAALGSYQASCTTWRLDLLKSPYRQPIRTA